MKIRLHTDYSVEASQTYRWASLWVMLATSSLNAIMHRSPEHEVGVVRINQYRLWSDGHGVAFYVSPYRSPYRSTHAPAVRLRAQDDMETVLNLEEAMHESIWR